MTRIKKEHLESPERLHNAYLDLFSPISFENGGIAIDRYYEEDELILTDPAIVIKIFYDANIP
jgi:hypothetical protein